MAIGTTNVNTIESGLRTMWADELSESSQAACVLSNLVDRSYDSTAEGAKTIKITNRSNPAVRFKATDTTATLANITETNQTLDVNLHAYVAFLVEDAAELQTNYNYRKEYTDASSYSLMATIEGDLTSGLMSLPSSFSQVVGTLGVDPGEDDWLQAKTYLDKADVPMKDRFILAASGTANSLIKLDRLSRADYVGQTNAENANLNGFVGRAYGADVFTSNLVYNNPSGGAASGQAYNWFCHKRGVVLVMKRKPTIHEQYILLEAGMAVFVDSIYNFMERLIVPRTLGGATANDNFNVAVRGS